MFSIVHNHAMPWKHGTFFLAQSLSTSKSLSDNTKIRFAVSLVEYYLYESIFLNEMLSSLKVAKKHMHVYCWDLRGMLETNNFVQKDSKQTIYFVYLPQFPSGHF